MKKREDIFKQSWSIVKNNKVLFAPNIITLIINVFILMVIFFLSGFFSILINNSYTDLTEILISPQFILFVILYVVASIFIDNFFLTTKYGLIQNVLLKGKTNLSEGFKFAKKYYWTTLGIHALSFLIIYIPMILLAIILFILMPLNPIIAMALFIPSFIAYIIYISIRLLFIFPVMTFEKKGAYNSLKEDFHFVKSHLHHTFMTWLVVLVVAIVASILRANVEFLQGVLQQQVIFLGVILGIAVIAIEVLVSVWEHVYIFKSYLVGKRKKN